MGEVGLGSENLALIPSKMSNLLKHLSENGDFIGQCVITLQVFYNKSGSHDIAGKLLTVAINTNNKTH